MDIIQNGEYFVTLIQSVLQVPCAVSTTMRLREDLERCLEGNTKVVPCTPNSPEEVRIAVLRSCDDSPIRKDQLA